MPHDQLRHRILLRSLDALRSATIHFISMGSTYWREKCVLHNILVDNTELSPRYRVTHARKPTVMLTARILSPEIEIQARLAKNGFFFGHLFFNITNARILSPEGSCSMANLTYELSSASDLWMSKWGFMSQPPAHFIGGRALRVLRSNLDATSGQGGSSIGSALQVPDFLRMQTYNPSIARLPQGVREELGCAECAYVAAARVDWFTECDGTRGSLDNIANIFRKAKRCFSLTNPFVPYVTPRFP